MCSASPCPLHAACAVPRRRQCKAPRAERFVTARAEASSASDAASDPVSTAERDAEGAERPSEDASSSPDELALLTTAGESSEHARIGVSAASPQPERLCLPILPSDPSAIPVPYRTRSEWEGTMD